VTARAINLVLAAAAVVAGCRKKSPAAAPAGAIVFQLSSRHPATDTSAHALVTTDTSLIHGRDTLFLRRVRIVLAELAIAPAVANECEEEEGEDNPPCVEFSGAPALFDLPLGPGVSTRATAAAPATDYNLFQALIHRPDSAADSALLAAHADFTGASIVVNGTISRGGRRRDFTFTSGFNEQEEIALDPALTVTAGDTLRITLRVDIASWFRSADGSAIVDPATAGLAGRHEGMVRDNIRTSLKVFRDSNADGLEDGSTQ
jgi:hypothetical protein